MEKIASFQVDHTRLLPGMYVSRMDGDVVTYDIRFIQPNTPPYMSTAAMHTIEHLFATYARSSVWGKGIVYVGPMGCRTGFYLLTRTDGHPDAVSPAEAIRLVQETMAFIMAFDGDIPGATEPECGNYREHDLPGARVLAARMHKTLAGWTAEKLVY